MLDSHLEKRGSLRTLKSASFAFQEVVRPEESQVEVTVNLPFLGEPLILVVKVCNDYNVCDRFEDPNPIQVIMPENFTVNDIR